MSLKELVNSKGGRVTHATAALPVWPRQAQKPKKTCILELCFLDFVSSQSQEYFL